MSKNTIARLLEARVASIPYPTPRLEVLSVTYKYPCCGRVNHKYVSATFTAPFTAVSTEVQVRCRSCKLNFVLTVSSEPNAQHNKPKVFYGFAFGVPNVKHICETPLYPKLCTHRCKNHPHCKKCKKCRCFMLKCGVLR
jgi:hypothetical protein